MQTSLKNFAQRRRFIAVANPHSTEMIVIGASAGGITILRRLLEKLPADFSVPIVVVQHFGAEHGESLANFFNEFTPLTVKEIEDKDPISSKMIYFAPADYHVLISKEKRLHLSIDAPVYYCRPSIDILFESAAFAFGEKLLAIIFSGANEDGAIGIEMVKKMGGRVAIQSIEDAEYPVMPAEALKRVPQPDFLASADELFDAIVNVEVSHST